MGKAIAKAGRAVIVGEVVIDIRGDQKVVAGAPLHVAAQLHALGWKVYFLSALGQDAEGDRAMAVLVELGIDTSLLQRVCDLTTPKVEIRPEGREHRFVFPTLGAISALQIPRRLPAHDLLVWSALIGVGSVGPERLDELMLRSSATFRCLDVNLRPPWIDREGLRRSVSATTILKVERSEVPTVLDVMCIDPEEGLKGLFGVVPGLEVICESAGADGAQLMLSDDREFHAPAPSVEVVDAVGAGDALTAGLMHAFALGMEPRAALHLALERARGVLSQPGGLPPEASEAAKRLAGIL
jgi:fructokinase